MWNFNLEWKGGQLFVAHAVSEDQHEHDHTGKLKDVQPARHEVTLLTMDLNISSQLGLLSWLDLRIFVPVRFVYATAEFFDHHGTLLKDYNSIHHRSETLVGIGDPTLQLGFRPFAISPKQPWFWDFGAGISLPFGRIEKDPYQAGRDGQEHQHIMFGSGTFDPMAFMNFGYVGSKAQLLLNLFARTSLYQNVYGLQEGLKLKASLTGESTFGLQQWSFLARVALSHQEPGLWSGKIDLDAASGRTDLILTAGVFWRPNDNWQVYCQISFPFNLHIVGGELSHPFIAGIGASYRFRLFR